MVNSCPFLSTYPSPSVSVQPASANKAFDFSLSKVGPVRALFPNSKLEGNAPTAGILPFKSVLQNASLSIAEQIACLTFKSCRAGVLKLKAT